jgi:hypothetical protein
MQDTRPVLALIALVLALVACGNQQRQEPGGQTPLPSAQLQSESAPPGDVPAPGTQNPYP